MHQVKLDHCGYRQASAGLLLLILFIIFFDSMEVHAARVVAEKRECATCHIAWMADFKREDVFTLIPNNPRPIEKTGRQDIVSTERMCFSCHDGFALDSRFLWQDGHNHPVGVKPSNKVQIPTDDGKVIFPLNDQGNIYCGTCHSAHGIEWGDKLSPVFLRARNIDSSLCIMCHGDRKGDMGGLQNHPLMKEVSNDSYLLHKVGSKFAQGNKVTCQSCHRVHAAKEDKLLVKRNERSQLCSTCHTDKDTETLTGAAKHFTHPVNKIPKSLSVPEQFEKAGSKFGPNKEIVCETCHQVHHAASDKLVLLGQDNLEEGICVICHDNKRGILVNGHNVYKSRKMEMAGSQLSPILGACGACHNIHGGEGPKMWARKLDAYGDLTARLCLSCHKKGKLAEDFTIGKYSHPVGAIIPNGVEPPAELPLFTIAGKRTASTKNGRVSCPTCHDIHGHQTIEPFFGFFTSSKKTNTNYLRLGEEDRLTLCKSCHREKWSVTDTKHDVERSDDNTGSTALGVCGTCHLVHNGLGPRMWARENVSKQADSSSLCLSCHTKGASAENKTVGEHSHPIGVSMEDAGINITNEGRGVIVGDSRQTVPPPLPLYNDKGSKKKDTALIGCGTCHDPHRWNATSTNDTPQANTLQDEGDSRNSFLRIPASPDGQLCTTCHRSKKTINATDHDMTISAPETRNILDSTPLQTGVCGQCHAVHNANQELALWARLPGQGRDAAEMLCRSCHSDGEVAQAKAPRKAHHPSYVKAWSSELRKTLEPNAEELPVFSSNGYQSEIGSISCPTCHNAHQWRADKAEIGSGENEEGDVLSSFLRLKSTEGFICADCHGLDSIYRYKYFHGAGSEQP